MNFEEELNNLSLAHRNVWLEKRHKKILLEKELLISTINIHNRHVKDYNIDWVLFETFNITKNFKSWSTSTDYFAYYIFNEDEMYKHGIDFNDNYYTFPRPRSIGAFNFKKQQIFLKYLQKRYRKLINLRLNPRKNIKRVPPML